jgi:hypothetical protein
VRRIHEKVTEMARALAPRGVVLELIYCIDGRARLSLSDGRRHSSLQVDDPRILTVESLDQIVVEMLRRLSANPA